MGRNVDYSLEDADLDEKAQGHNRLIWVEGHAVVMGFHEDRILDCDRAFKILADLGLHPHATLTSLEVPPKGHAPRRKFSGTRIPLEDLRITLAIQPGLTGPEYAELAYKTWPWTELARAAALHRFKVSFKRLEGAGLASRDTRQDGEPLYGPRGWSRDSRPALDPSEAPNVKMIKEGAALLAGDHALALRVYAAMRRHVR